MAERLLRHCGIEAGRPLIGLAPGAAYGPAKRWFPERFAAVVDRLIDETGAQTILFGSGGDKESTAAVARNSRHPLIDLAGKTDLKEAIALIVRCGLFLSNDSGLMHVAGALGIPTVAIFGSTNPATTSPVGDRSIVIHRDVTCSPCLKPSLPDRFSLHGSDRRGRGPSRGTDAFKRREGMRKEHGQAAVFLDRDGTINEEVGYMDRLDKLKLIPVAAEAIRLINASGMKAVVVTNQSGVARGLFDESFVDTVHIRLREMLRMEGAFLDGIYFCPHHPTEGRERYLMTCDCRKPAPGLLLQAAADLHLEPVRSYMVGDTLKDIEAGARAGARGVLVRTGYGSESADTLRLNETSERKIPGKRDDPHTEPVTVPTGPYRRRPPRRRQVDREELETVNILIVKLSAIGDVIHTLPSLAALRRCYPDADITWVIEEAAADLLSGHPDLDRVLILRRKTWIRDIRQGRIAAPLREMRTFLRDTPEPSLRPRHRLPRPPQERRHCPSQRG